jgi:hypothetical protein
MARRRLRPGERVQFPFRGASGVDRRGGGLSGDRIGRRTRERRRREATDAHTARSISRPPSPGMDDAGGLPRTSSGRGTRALTPQPPGAMLRRRPITLRQRQSPRRTSVVRAGGGSQLSAEALIGLSESAAPERGEQHPGAQFTLPLSQTMQHDPGARRRQSATHRLLRARPAFPRRRASRDGRRRPCKARKAEATRVSIRVPQ